MLSLTSSGIADLADDLSWLADCLNALFHPDYRGDTKAETLGMLESAKAKGLGSTVAAGDYEPSTTGPIPLGYTKEGLYALRDEVRQLIIQASSNQLLSYQYLLGLAPSDFWRDQFPAKKGGFNFLAAGEALIDQCKRAGPFNPLRVRGRGVWLEGAEIIANFGGPIPAGVRHVYLCFEPINLDGAAPFDTSRLLKLLRLLESRPGTMSSTVIMLTWMMARRLITGTNVGTGSTGPRLPRRCSGW